jgi:putative membrane protein
MKEVRRLSITAVVISILISALIYFFIGVKFDLSLLSKIVISLIALFSLIYFSIRSTSEFSLFSLVSITTFIGLTTAFASSIVANGLINIPLKLGVWPIFILTLLFSAGMMFIYGKMKNPDKYSIILFITFLVYWVLIAINAKYLDGWISENALVVPFLIIIFFVHKWFKFSKLSYSLIFTFMVLHVMGSHYTYSEVPLGYWMSEFFGLERNHFDRVVHFSFGFLWAYPMREIFRRIADAKGFWAFWIPVELVLALSCVFELIEWVFAVIFGGDLGIAYLGTQGDIWDAQKDMALAGLGSIIAMLITAGIIIYLDRKNFFREFKESFKVKSKAILGEVALEKMIKKK